MKDPTIAHQVLRSYGYSLFAHLKVAKSVYIPTIDSLVETSLRGVDSHGVRLIPHYARAVMTGRVNPQPNFHFKKTSLTTGILDADHGFGIAAGIVAMDSAIALAQKNGIGAVGVIHSTHFGAAAIFGLRPAYKGMIGMALTDVDALVFPYGGKKTYFGTNPLCFTAPIKGEEPFCVDMASTRVPLNKILAYRRMNKKLPPGWAVDAQGKPTTDPQKAVSPIPIGDYKGYSLAMMISILSSVLVGMPFGPHITPMYPLKGIKRNLGHFMLALDIKRFRSLDEFKKDMKEMVTELRSIPRVAEDTPVYVPGDPEKKEHKNRLKNGIPIASIDVAAQRDIAQELGMVLPF